MAACALLSVSAYAANLVLNPSLEYGTGGSPDDWYYGQLGAAAFVWTNIDAATGSSCGELRVESPGAGTNADLRSSIFSVDGYSHLSWRFAYRFLTNSAGGLSGTPEVFLRFFSDPGGTAFISQDTVQFSALENMTNWAEIDERMVAVPATAKSADVWVTVDLFASFAGVFRVDDFVVDTTSVVQVGLVSNYSFEYGAAGSPSDWYNGAYGDAYFLWHEGDANTGENCVELRVESPGIGTNADLRSKTFSLKEFADGGQVTWQFAYKFLESDGAELWGTPEVFLRFFQDEAGALWLSQDAVSFTNVSATTGWLTNDLRLVDVPEEAFYADVWVAANRIQQFAGRFRIDDIIVLGIPEPVLVWLPVLALLTARSVRGRYMGR